jgi:thiamine-phosphate pyrophosphorylase
VKRAVYRIIDANLNRSREGLRVCEEIARFALNSPALSKELKSVRHGISAAAMAISPASKALCGARDSKNDPGRESGLKSEMSRRDLSEIFAANMGRSKESLRVLEEVSKLGEGRMAARFARLRFALYEVEKKAVKKLASLRNIR